MERSMDLLERREAHRHKVRLSVPMTPRPAKGPLPAGSGLHFGKPDRLPRISYGRQHGRHHAWMPEAVSDGARRRTFAADGSHERDSCVVPDLMIVAVLLAVLAAVAYLLMRINGTA